MMTSEPFMSPTVGKIAGALSRAQGEFTAVPRSATNASPNINKPYSTLSDVLETSREPLSKHGLALIQIPMDASDAEFVRVSMRTVLVHEESGEWFASVASMIVGQVVKGGAIAINAHAVMSAYTYLRRLQAGAMLGLAPDDDDGNAAAGVTTNKQKTQASAARTSAPDPRGPVTQEQKNALTHLCGAAGVEVPDFAEMTYGNAATLITRMNANRQKPQDAPPAAAQPALRVESSAPAPPAAEEIDDVASARAALFATPRFPKTGRAALIASLIGRPIAESSDITAADYVQARSAFEARMAARAAFEALVAERYVNPDSRLIAELLLSCGVAGSPNPEKVSPETVVTAFLLMPVEGWKQATARLPILIEKWKAQQAEQEGVLAPEPTADPFADRDPVGAMGL